MRKAQWGISYDTFLKLDMHTCGVPHSHKDRNAFGVLIKEASTFGQKKKKKKTL